MTEIMIFRYHDRKSLFGILIVLILRKMYFIFFSLRKSTWERLLLFSGGTLSELLDQLTKRDLLYPLLTDEHNKGIERRMLMIYAAVELCFESFGKETVLK